eukprot:6490407-Amphidinium_carterae.1
MKIELSYKTYEDQHPTTATTFYSTRDKAQVITTLLKLSKEGDATADPARINREAANQQASPREATPTLYEHPDGKGKNKGKAS